MDETDQDRGCVTCAVGLNAFERLSALEDVLGCFSAAVSGMRPLKRTIDDALQHS